ncbi:hypothetical protein LP420_11660 [Massilia sp. B-10]|nr:hypothetical protein LP420_11660 [Massilia sp. B-10]
MLALLFGPEIGQLSQLYLNAAAPRLSDGQRTCSPLRGRSDRRHRLRQDHRGRHVRRTGRDPGRHRPDRPQPDRAGRRRHA